MYLPGGVLVTIDHLTSARTWSYPNLHGHHTATSNHTGAPQTRTTYDPWGNPQNPVPNNTTGTADLNAYGANGKLTETTTTKPITHMGARPYTPTTARFLTIDPIHGGCANNYTYGYGDPINARDLSGKAEEQSCWAFLVRAHGFTVFGGVHEGRFGVAGVFHNSGASFGGSQVSINYEPASFGAREYWQKESPTSALLALWGIVGGAAARKSPYGFSDVPLLDGGGQSAFALAGPINVAPGGQVTSMSIKVVLAPVWDPAQIMGLTRYEVSFTCGW